MRPIHTRRHGVRTLAATTLAAALAPVALVAPATLAPAGAPQAAAATSKPLAGVVIGLDAGHNGGRNAAWLNHLVNAGFGTLKPCNTTGTSTSSGYSEHAHNFDVVMRARRELQALGATVVLTRTTDTGLGPCINVRAAIFTRAHTQLNISVHADGNYAAGARGFHVIYPARAQGGARVLRTSRALALVMRSTFQSRTGMPRSTYVGRGTALSPRSDLAYTNLAWAPSVMFEAGNMRNARDARLLSSATFRQREADAITAGVRAYLHR